MTHLLILTEEERKLIFTNAGVKAGNIRPEAVEKDWWVTLVLRAIYQTEYAPYLLFKGGTSLSKCWKLIERFSEDIDLAIDRDYLGFPGNISKSAIHRLKKTATNFTSYKLKDAVKTQLLLLGVPEGMVQITHTDISPDLQDKDPQELQIQYPTLFKPLDYIKNVVKVEVSGTSMKDPFATCQVSSIVDEQYPESSFADPIFSVRAILPERTFLEKMFLMHEEFNKKTKRPADRLSRHLYDLEKMMDTLHGWAAIENIELYQDIIEHRRKFNKLAGIDYSTHETTTISFLPPAEQRNSYEQDYGIMRNTMIHGEKVDFKVLMTRLEKLIQRLRNPAFFKRKSRLEIIEQARLLDPKDTGNPNFMIEGAQIKIDVQDEENKYRITFVRENSELVVKAVTPIE